MPRIKIEGPGEAMTAGGTTEDQVQRPHSPMWPRLVAFAVRRETVWKTTWAFRLSVVVGLALVWAISWHFWLTLAGAALVERDALERVDVIIVEVTVVPSLSGLKHAAKLYRAGYAPRVFLTRYIPNDRLDASGLQVPQDFADVLKVYAAEARLPLSVVDTIPIGVSDPVTLNTARQVAAYCAAQGIRSAIVVAPLFHSRRSELTYRHFFKPLGIRVLSQPFESGQQITNWWRTKEGWLTVVQESVELLYYRLFVL
jgi:uncharacterized SAM-binding protein YcdF (DUF218 family)